MAQLQPLPADLQSVIDQMDAADAAAERLVRPLNDAQFHWSPEGGTRWSIAQCLEHLAVANELYGERVAAAVAAARSRGWKRRRPLRPGFFGRRFADSLEPPVKRRTKAPGKIRPASTLGRVEILRRYVQAHDRLRRAAREAIDVDANRATFPNPFIGLIRVKVSTAFAVVCAHDRRHLWQAEQVREAKGFPAS